MRLPIIGLCSALALAGCGGGGGGSGGGPLTGTCSVASEKDAIFSIMRDWYFFNDPDFPGQQGKYNNLNLNGFTDAQDLLDFLRYGPLDANFSFITTVEADNQFLSEGEFITFGFNSTFVANNDLRITRVFEGSPADQAGFQRGFRILEIDGETIADLVQAGGIDFGPAEEGFTINFLLEDLNGGQFNVDVSKARVTIDPVPPVPTRIIDVNGRPVGYVNFRSFISTANAKLDTVFAEFQNANVQDLVIDVRYNGGGLVSVAEHFGDLLGGAIANGQVFAEIRYNDDRAANNNSTSFFSSLGGSLPLLQQLVFITNGSSASASELMINSMLPHTTVIVVGSTTFGKPVGQSAFDFCADTKRFRPVTFEIVNSLGAGRYFDGIQPDCPAEDDLDFAQGDPNEASLAAALTRIDTGVCPPAPLQQKTAFVKEMDAVFIKGWDQPARQYLGAH